MQSHGRVIGVALAVAAVLAACESPVTPSAVPDGTTASTAGPVAALAAGRLGSHDLLAPCGAVVGTFHAEQASAEVVRLEVELDDAGSFHPWGLYDQAACRPPAPDRDAPFQFADIEAGHRVEEVEAAPYLAFAPGLVVIVLNSDGSALLGCAVLGGPALVQSPGPSTAACTPGDPPVGDPRAAPRRQRRSATHLGCDNRSIPGVVRRRQAGVVEGGHDHGARRARRHGAAIGHGPVPGLVSLGGHSRRGRLRLAAGCAAHRPTQGSAHDIDDLVDVAVGVAIGGGSSDAAGDVVLEDEHGERIDRCSQRTRLLEDVHAVFLALDHSRNATHLALDPCEPADQLRLVAGVAVAEMVDGASRKGFGVRHPAMILPGGMSDKPGCPRAVPRPTGYTHPWMDPLDHLLALPDGLCCTVCDERVPAERVKLLAWRDDLAFLQIDCGSCFSTTLAFVMGGRTDASGTPPDADPIGTDDVLDMHELLATWRGDLTGLLPQHGRGRAETSR